MTAVLAATWDDLVTTGLLGTDRREPPALPNGPLADAVADAVRPTAEGRLLAAVATTVVARRCGALPLPPRPTLQPPAIDGRPLLPSAAAGRWRSIVAEWPVLEAEWLAVATASGWRPSADVLVAMLRRHHRTPIVAGAVLAWGGPPAAWLVDQLPDLAPVDARAAVPLGDVRPLPAPAELEPLLLGDAHELAHVLTSKLLSGAYRWSHRAVLLNVVARMDAGSLPVVVAALRRGHPLSGSGGEDAAPLAVWESLIELAVVRGQMLSELQQEATGAR